MKKIRAEILTIGDEILYGQIVDTNSQWMGAELSNAGIKVIRKTAVGDVEEEIMIAFAEAEKRADIILITGGLGPTNDDLTKPCLAKYFDCEMQIHEGALDEVSEFFTSRGRALTELNRLQASLPVCCEKITNRLGTAPGMWFHRNEKVFVSMPGVPHEMKVMMREIIIPKLRQTFNPPVIHHTIIRMVGIGESFLAEKISSWEKSLPPHIRLAFLPGYGEVKLRLTALGTDQEILRHEADALVEKIKPLAGEYIYAIGDDPLEVVVGNLLRAKKLTLSAAESCTGGYLSHVITSVSGSSDYFSGSMVAYSNEIKIKDLGVKRETLEQHGAVSEATIREMAAQVRLKFKTDIGVATSGIAGPGGGTPDKPVGTVWIGYADSHQTIARKLQLSKDRLINIKISSTQALNLIRTALQTRL
ncbi:MAG: competence/damage-inducible protein A [Cyclobacteriaceae bacterium]